MDKRVWLGNAGRLNFIGLLLVLGCAAWPHAALAADGVVGTGGAASCTEAAFDDTWSAVQSSGGGIITFSCGPAPVTILFTAQKAVSADTELRGGDLISLSGGNATSLFQVFSGQTLRLRNMTLTRAYSLTGAIENFGVVDAQDSHFVNNSATDSGGAISNNGDLTLTRVRFAGNSAVANGGALNLISGNATIIDSQFTGNFATTAIAPPQYGGGGAIYSAAALTITQSVFTQNSAPSGGALFVRTGAASVAETTFSGNWAVENGGAIVNFQASLGLWDSELKGNGYNLAGVKVTQAGGALNSVSGSSTLVGVTLSGNWAGAGGAYYQQAQLATLTNVTISGNAAAVGGGIYSGFMSYTTLRNVTIAGNSASGRGGRHRDCWILQFRKYIAVGQHQFCYGCRIQL